MYKTASADLIAATITVSSHTIHSQAVRVSIKQRNAARNLTTDIMFILASLLLAGVSAESPAGDMRQKYDISSQQMLSVSGCIKELNINYAGNTTEQTKLESPQACAEHCVSVEGALFCTFSYCRKSGRRSKKVSCRSS